MTTFSITDTPLPSVSFSVVIKNSFKMPAYHSAIPSDNCKFIGNVPILPLKILNKTGGSGTRGPAPPSKNNEVDIVDESLDVFKANVFFSNFEINEKPDLVLLYCILYITGFSQICSQLDSFYFDYCIF